jgi:tetratricopeptide (TPR) repeat protein
MSRAPAGIALVLTLLLTASFCLTRLAEVDLHWHLLAGERILDERRVPRTDSFTFTSAGRPWVDLHWLFQVMVAGLRRVAGERGLDLLKIALVTGGFVLAILAALRRSGAAATAPLALLAVVASQERFALRPEAVSFLLMGALLLGLEVGRSRPRVLWGLPPLLALWANLHALYAAGLAALLLAIGGDHAEATWLRRGPGGDEPRPAAGVRRPILVAGLAVLATLLTPYGFAAWALPGRLLLERIGADNLYHRSIAEFQPPLGGYGPTASTRAFALLALVSVLALAAGFRKARLSDLLLAGAFLVLALLARRNIPLFALVALPTVAPAARSALGDRLASLARRRPRAVGMVRRLVAPALLTVAAAALALLAQVWGNRFYERDGTQRYFGTGEAPGFYPAGAAAFIRERRLPGEAIHGMTIGGYLAWRWFPERRVFIDGRLEVHDPALYARYLRLQADPRIFEETAGIYGADLVVWSLRESPEAAPLLRYLAGDHGWRLVFIDIAAAVFARRGVEALDRLPSVDPGDPLLAGRIGRQMDEAERAASQGDPAPALLRRFLPRREVPVTEVNAALFFGVIGRPRPAEVFFRRALAKAPENAVLHYDLGLAVAGENRGEEARRCFEEALRRDPSFAPARSALALARLRAGDEEGALDEWRRAERSGPLDPASLRARAGILSRRGRIDEAIEDLRRAARAEPQRAALRAELALLYQQAGMRDQALREIRRGMEIDPDDAAPRIALARIQAAEGDPAAAERTLREVVATRPGNPEARLHLAALLARSGRADEALRQIESAVASGLDRSLLSAEPSFRILAGRPEFERLLESPRQGGVEGER